MNIEFSSLIWVDYCLIALIALSAFIGLVRGLVREVFSLVLWAVAGWLAFQYSRGFSVHLESMIPVPSFRMAVSALAIFMSTLVVGGLLGFLLSKLVSSTGLSGTDRLAGLVFGVARGVLIASVLVLLAGVTPIPEDPWWKQSKLIPPLQSLALWLRDQLPTGLAAQVKYPEVLLKR